MSFFPALARLQARQRALAPAASLPAPPLHAAAGLAAGCGAPPSEAYLSPAASRLEFAAHPPAVPSSSPAVAPAVTQLTRPA